MRTYAIAAITLDGKIALDANHFSDWTSPEDKKMMRDLLYTSDVVVVGNNTYKTAIEPLSKRNCIVLTTGVSTTEHHSDTLTYANPQSSDFVALLERYENIAVLGGAKTYSYFLQNNLLDELYLTIEPVAFGRGINLFEHESGETAHFKLLSTEKLNDTGSMLLHYEMVR